MTARPALLPWTDLWEVTRRGEGDDEGRTYLRGRLAGLRVLLLKKHQVAENGATHTLMVTAAPPATPEARPEPVGQRQAPTRPPVHPASRSRAGFATPCHGEGNRERSLDEALALDRDAYIAELAARFRPDDLDENL
jgi:hypothetical protein